MKNVCLKIFPKLAAKTNLDPEELQTYYAIRFQYLNPYSDKIKAHEDSLCKLAQSLMRGGKIQYEIREASDSGSSMEESKSKVVVQFTHDFDDVTLDQSKEVIEDLKRTNLKHEFWKKFGFQNNNPRTDFRSSGILGLHQFDYFANKYPRELFQATTIQNDYFFLALFSIRLTHVIIVLFHLMSPQDRRTKVPPNMMHLKCTRI